MVDFIGLLKKEVIPAEGCTEPVAVAYATAMAATYLDDEIKEIKLLLSANIIKNALGVGIPGTGKIGIEIAAALGTIIKKPEKKLEILSDFSKEDLSKANQLVDQKRIQVLQKMTSEKLYIEAILKSEKHSSRVIICKNHTKIIKIEKDNHVLYEENVCSSEEKEDTKTGLTVENIYNFATNVDFKDISFILECADMNRKVSKEGMKGGYGLQVGNKISAKSDKNSYLLNNATLKIISATAAASDARMDGCTMPIMTTAGSGNQGIACTLPVIELARMLESSDEELARALVISDLMVIYIKEHMGRLSPLCGAGIAGSTGACCGMTYLQGGSFEQMNYAISNMIATLSGLICDGAKTTCALKIATGTNAAIQCSTLALNNISPTGKDGIIFDHVEDTIKNIGKLVREGLTHTDDTILSIMLAK